MGQLAAAYQLPSLHFEFISSELLYLPPTLNGFGPKFEERTGISTLTNAPLDLSQFKAQDEFQQRFHQAVSALWLVSEVVKLASIIQLLQRR